MFGINFGAKRTKFFAEALYRYGQSDVSYRNGGAEPWTGTMDVGYSGAGGNVIQFRISDFGFRIFHPTPWEQCGRVGGSSNSSFLIPNYERESYDGPSTS